MRRAMTRSTCAALFGKHRNRLELKLHRIQQGIVQNHHGNLDRMRSISDGDRCTTVSRCSHPAAMEADDMTVRDTIDRLLSEIMRNAINKTCNYQLTRGSAT